MIKKRYNLNNLMNYDALISILYGERSNGKSYQLKHKVMLTKDVLEGDRCFMLVRRFEKEITTEKIERYFDDVNFEMLTDGKYDCVVYYRREIFLGKYNYETFKKEKGPKIGYVVPLEKEQDYAGASFLDVDNIIFEEFMSRSRYLHDEPNKLMNLYCTVDRKRGKVKLWLCGNTLSRVCPYLTDWDLMGLMRKQEQGSIVTKRFDVGSGEEILMALEFCEDTGETSYTIGSHASMLNGGSWQSDPQPHLEKSIKEYNAVFRCVFEYKGFRFLGTYYMDPATGETVWFICDKFSEIKKRTFVFTDIIRQDFRSYRDPYSVRCKNRKIEEILNDFRENKIFYSTDLTGTDFKQSIDFIIRR